jgi:hypothetical protein
MKPITQAPSVEGSSQQEFGAGILATDASHHSRSSCGIHYVGHAIFPGDSSPTWYWTSTMTNRSPR